MSARAEIDSRNRQRTSAACDACRERKVKCVIPIGQSQCAICMNLSINCTNMRPRKKRGPKNRYVQALRTRLDGCTDPGDLGPSTLELIAPFAIVHQIMADWFDWFHPVAPLLHHGLFMQRVSSDDSSTAFFLLVASVCAATVASLQRRRHRYGAVTVDGCLELAERFKLCSLSSRITLERGLALYNFSCAAQNEHGIDSPLAHRLMADSSISVKYLLHHEFGRMSFLEQQILKRLYWLIYAGQCTFDMHGRQMVILRHAHEPVSTMLPLEITDHQLFHGLEPISPEYDPSPEDSYVPGLNALSKLFMVWQSSQAIHSQTMENLQEHITRAQRILNELPPKLSWHMSHVGRFGFNVQKVNLKVTQLHIRSNLLEQMNSIAKNDETEFTPGYIVNERYCVVEELLDVLYNMPEADFDANGYSIVPKIRDIGGALLDDLRTGTPSSSLQAGIDMGKLLAKLESLDQRSAAAAQSPYS